MDQFNILTLDRVGSTNDYASAWIKENNPPECSVVVTSDQTSGKGRQQRDWHSAPGLNLTFSVILYPHFLKAIKQFYLSILASLAIIRVLEKKVEKVSIKWPNDIILGDDKIAGILIENAIQGDFLASSILGMGVNINEDPMPAALSAISLKQATGKSYDKETLLKEILTVLMHLYDRLKAGDYLRLKEEYESQLYFRNKASIFEKADMVIPATAKGINEMGHLIIQLSDGSEMSGNMDELSWKRFA